MKSALILVSSFLLVAAVHGSALFDTRTNGNYIQNPSGMASFTPYSNCSSPACGKSASGPMAAMNALSFGSPSSAAGPGDACGRCFNVTGTSDPNPPSNSSQSTSMVVKVFDLCSAQDDPQFCNQTLSNTTNSVGQPVHFKLCQDSGAAGDFFPQGSENLTGTYQEVSCAKWPGLDGSNLTEGACFANNQTDLWPSSGCGNQDSFGRELTSYRNPTWGSNFSAFISSLSQTLRAFRHALTGDVQYWKVEQAIRHGPEIVLSANNASGSESGPPTSPAANNTRTS
ncbi:RlpA-like double-psi beta-barrel-protein domain-containing protein-containing protein [Lactarius quietus]|nr:RlpA-like double-psi beta-barrel-protein domain-containing protein-containing protein [Lactarius quietus]